MSFLKKIFFRNSELVNDLSKTRVCFNGDFYFIEPLVDYFSMPDRDGVPCYLTPDTLNQELGDAILSGLNSYRVLPNSEHDIYDEDGLAHEDDKNKYQIKKYGYKNKTALLHNMLEVLVYLENENIDFKPFRKLGLQVGEAISDDDYNIIVRIPSNASPEEVGRAARLALSRCENPLGEKKGLPKHNFNEFL